MGISKEIANFVVTFVVALTARFSREYYVSDFWIVDELFGLSDETGPCHRWAGAARFDWQRFFFSVLRWRNINEVDYWEGATIDCYVRKIMVGVTVVSRPLPLSMDR